MIKRLRNVANEERNFASRHHQVEYALMLILRLVEQQNILVLDLKIFEVEITVFRELIVTLVVSEQPDLLPERAVLLYQHFCEVLNIRGLNNLHYLCMKACRNLISFVLGPILCYQIFAHSSSMCRASKR